ncbi:MAG: Spy/CpxP family protein refolding chaperone, partial [Solimonas sp.]
AEAPMTLAFNAPGDLPPSPDHGPDHGPGDRPDRGGPRFGGEGRFFGGPAGGMQGGPLLRELHGLDLSDSQQDAIDDVFVKHHKEQRELFKRGRDLHRSYRELDPVAKDYASRSNKLADQAGQLTRDELQLRTRITSEVVATLTPDQAQKLQAERAEKRAERAERHAQGKGAGKGADQGPGQPSKQ